MSGDDSAPRAFAVLFQLQHVPGSVVVGSVHADYGFIVMGIPRVGSSSNERNVRQPRQDVKSTDHFVIKHAIVPTINTTGLDKELGICIYLLGTVTPSSGAAF